MSIPARHATAIGAQDRSRSDLRVIAQLQRGTIVCFLAYVLVGLFTAVLSDDPGPLYFVTVAVIAVINAVVVMLLGIKVLPPAVGVVMGFCAIIPCFGAVPLLVVSLRASSVLEKNGVPVSLMGADMSRL